MAGYSVVNSADKKVAWMDVQWVVSKDALSVVLKAARSVVYWAALLDVTWVDEKDASLVVEWELWKVVV